MQGDPTIGLDLIANNANLTFIYFIAFVLQAMISVRFAYYAERNRRTNDVAGQNALWAVLLFVGISGGTYAILGIVDIVSSVDTAYRNGVVIAHVALLAMALRVLQNSAVPPEADESGLDRRTVDRWLWLLAALATVGIVLATATLGEGDPVYAAEGLAAVVLSAIGVVAGVRATAQSRVQGTVVDTLLRHLLPVLLFASFVPLVSLAVLAGLPREIVLHVQVVFVIMAATALMTATIKLRQNLAGL